MAGVSKGSQWQTQIVDDPKAPLANWYLSIPPARPGFLLRTQHSIEGNAGNEAGADGSHDCSLF
ncbi:hypothetical protein [Leptothermofonsia sp. ETS-13]|uniref:hypothetical protein n=1 Tax=Leptothermofonsia sp. ETS-13 TaxID=3035696 RepID=UPI003BA1D44C